MSNEYLNMKTVIFFLLSLLFAVVIVENVLADKGKTELAEEPLRTLIITIDVNQREIFFCQLKKFSDKHGFAIRLAPNTPDGKSFIGQVWREDIKLVVVNPFEEDKYKVYFYQNDTPSVDEAMLDSLVFELSTLLSKKGFAVNERKVSKP